jgi:hypothetical protein
MTTNEVLTFIQNSPVAHAVSKSNHMVGAGLQIVHVLGFILLLAALLMLSLRLLGLILKKQPLPLVARDATRLIWVGLGAAVASGVLMFVSTPKLYYFNWAFELKMALFLAAIIVQLALFRRVAASESPSPALARTAVALSLLSWFGVGLAGRMIGFI